MQRVRNEFHRLSFIVGSSMLLRYTHSTLRLYIHLVSHYHTHAIPQSTIVAVDFYFVVRRLPDIYGSDQILTACKVQPSVPCCKLWPSTAAILRWVPQLPWFTSSLPSLPGQFLYAGWHGHPSVIAGSPAKGASYGPGVQRLRCRLQARLLPEIAISSCVSVPLMIKSGSELLASACLQLVKNDPTPKNCGCR